jgi:hypothetical protein
MSENVILMKTVTSVIFCIFLQNFSVYLESPLLHSFFVKCLKIYFLKIFTLFKRKVGSPALKSYGEFRLRLAL